MSFAHTRDGEQVHVISFWMGKSCIFCPIDISLSFGLSLMHIKYSTCYVGPSRKHTHTHTPDTSLGLVADKVSEVNLSWDMCRFG